MGPDDVKVQFSEGPGDPIQHADTVGARHLQHGGGGRRDVVDGHSWAGRTGGQVDGSVGARPVTEAGRHGQAAGQGPVDLFVDPRPVGFAAQHRSDTEHRECPPMLGMSRRTKDISPVEGQHAGHLGKRARAVSGHHGQLQPLSTHHERPVVEQGLLGGIRKRAPDHIADVAPTQYVRGAFHQLTDQARLPVAPRRRAGSDRIGFGEGPEEAQQDGSAHCVSHLTDSAVVVEVSPGGHVGQQQVVFDHGDQQVDIVALVAHSGGNGRQEVDADHRVVTWIPLADVVEQGTDQ